MHPLLQLVATQPQLLAEHAESYGELVAGEFAALSRGLGRRTLLLALAVCGLGVAAVLAGVAVMLWAVLPAAEGQAILALLFVPLVPAAAALACLVSARTRDEARAFDALRHQLRADLSMLREMATP